METSKIESIQRQKQQRQKFCQNYLEKLLKQEQESYEYKQKIIRLINSNSVEKSLSQTKNSLSQQQQSSRLNPVHQTQNSQTFSCNQNTKKSPTEQQLCEILKILKKNNKKTSIELTIKILHEILCPVKSQQFRNSVKQSEKNRRQSSYKNNIKIEYDRFKNYEIRFSQYKQRITQNYITKNQKVESIVKKEYNDQQPNQSVKSINQNFIQFSVPYHVVEYFKHKNTSAFRKDLDRQPHSQRRKYFKQFVLKGHTLPDYEVERKTAKIFCLVGPGVRAARQFLGQDLGSRNHSKNVSNVVKITYRFLEQYINDNLWHFLKPSDIPDHSSQPQFCKKEDIKHPCYYASRRELSTIKTPLFNCRNWMDDDELKLFFLFVKKAYRIKYPKEWENDKGNEIFLLYGKIVKKLLEKDILIRNLQVLKGDDIIQNSKIQGHSCITKKMQNKKYKKTNSLQSDKREQIHQE